MDFRLRQSQASTTARHPADWSQAPRITKVLAALVMVLVSLGLYLTYLAGRAYEIQGPLRIASNDSSAILIGTYQDLYLIDANRLTKLSVSTLGLVGPITSITPDGNQWLLGDDYTGLIYRCTEALKACAPLVANLNGERMFGRAHGVALLDGKIIVSDSERHRLRVFDREQGQIAVTRTNPVELCYPNDVMAFEGSLYVTDTNNFRIAQIYPQEGFRSETFIQTSAGSPITSANCADISSRVAKKGDAYGNLILDTTVTVGRPSQPPARARRILPASIIRTSRGEWWVVQMKNLMQAGDVVVYANGQAIKRIALPENSDPVDLVETRDGVLIADPTLSRIYDVSLDGTVRGDWGPIELKSDLEKIPAMRARWEMFKPISWGVLGLAVLLGLIVIAREFRRTNGNINAKQFKLEPVDSPPAPLSEAEEWLGVSAKFAKTMQRTYRLGAIFLIVYFAAEGYLIFDIAGRLMAKTPAPNYKPWVFLGSMLIAMGAVFLYVIVTARRQVHMRIGADGQKLLFDPGNSSIEYCDFAYVLVSGKSLLIGKRLIRSHNNFGTPVYPVDRLTNVILARIPRENFIKALPFALQALKRGNFSAWTVVVCFAIVLLVEGIPLLLPDQAAAIKQFFTAWLLR